MSVAQHDMKRLTDKNRFGSFTHPSLVEPVLLSISAHLHDYLSCSLLDLFKGTASSLQLALYSVTYL